MQPITPHLWFDTEAVQAAEFYTATFGNSEIVTKNTLRDTPSGDCDIVSFTLEGQPFQAISAGPLFTLNPSISFIVACAAKDEVDALWNRLSGGGTALMPLDSYPFSERYGWIQDRFGVSWQVMYTGDGSIAQKIVPMLMFVGEVGGKADEAVQLYTSVFPNSRTDDITRYGSGDEPDKEGTIQYGRFRLDGYELAVMDSAHEHQFSFNEAISLMAYCDTQEQIDHYWKALSAVPEAEQCGWLKDRFGVSWQIVPRALDKMLADADEETTARVTKAFLAMKKFDIAELEKAYAAR